MGDSAALLSSSQLTACQTLPCSCWWLNSEWDLIPNNCSLLRKLQGISDLIFHSRLLVESLNFNQNILESDFVVVGHFNQKVFNQEAGFLQDETLLDWAKKFLLFHCISGPDTNHQCSQILFQPRSWEPQVLSGKLLDEMFDHTCSFIDPHGSLLTKETVLFKCTFIQTLDCFLERGLSSLLVSITGKSNIVNMFLRLCTSIH